MPIGLQDREVGVGDDDRGMQASGVEPPDVIVHGIGEIDSRLDRYWGGYGLGGNDEVAEHESADWRQHLADPTEEVGLGLGSAFRPACASESGVSRPVVGSAANITNGFGDRPDTERLSPRWVTIANATAGSAAPSSRR